MIDEQKVFKPNAAWVVLTPGYEYNDEYDVPTGGFTDVEIFDSEIKALRRAREIDKILNSNTDSDSEKLMCDIKEIEIG